MPWNQACFPSHPIGDQQPATGSKNAHHLVNCLRSVGKKLQCFQATNSLELVVAERERGCRGQKLPGSGLMRCKMLLGNV
jgi:hypothetical protein